MTTPEKVTDLHPTFSGQSYVKEFTIDCPLCGKRLSFKAWWQSGPKDGIHGTTATCGPALDWDTLTVVPSLLFPPGSAHGKKSTCAPHFSITNGRIVHG